VDAKSSRVAILNRPDALFDESPSVLIDQFLANQPVKAELLLRIIVQFISVGICGDLRSTSCYSWIERAGLCLMRAEWARVAADARDEQASRQPALGSRSEPVVGSVERGKCDRGRGVA
jgi:hypothetical protein